MTPHRAIFLSQCPLNDIIFDVRSHLISGLVVEVGGTRTFISGPRGMDGKGKGKVKEAAVDYSLQEEEQASAKAFCTGLSVAPLSERIRSHEAHGITGAGALLIKAQQLQNDLERTRQELEARLSKLKQNTKELCELSRQLQDKVDTSGHEFVFMRAAALREWSGGPLPKLQYLPAGMTHNRTRTLKEVVIKNTALARKLIVFHRWVQAGNPDPKGDQTEAVIAHLRSHPEIEFVWFDFWCLPQMPRTPSEETTFRNSLRSVYLLYLGASVLILFDKAYNSRFWTNFEAWLSMRQASADGLTPAAEARVSVACLGATKDTAEENIAMLSATCHGLTPQAAYDLLKEDDILVTNKRDKEEQLKVLVALADNVPCASGCLTPKERPTAGDRVKIVREINRTNGMIGHIIADDHSGAPTQLCYRTAGNSGIKMSGWRWWVRTGP